MKNIYCILVLYAFCGGLLQAQPNTKMVRLSWQAANTQAGVVYPNFLEGNYVPFYENLPVFTHTFEQTSQEITLKNLVYENLPQADVPACAAMLTKIMGEAVLTQQIGFERKEARLVAQVFPFRKTAQGIVQRLVSFDMVLDGKRTQATNAKPTPETVINSVLAQGTWYKIGVVQTGIYKLDKAFFTALGVNTNGFNPKNIRIVGYGGGMLPQKNSAFRYNDLPENAITVVGEADDVFNDQDYAVFYAQDAHKWVLNNGKFAHEQNLYADTSFYFINVDGGVAGKRMATTSETRPVDLNVNTYTARTYLEQDKTNLLGSGKNWLGDLFDLQTTYNYDFSFPNRLTDQTVWIAATMAASWSNSSIFSFKANGAPLQNLPIPYANLGSGEGYEAQDNTLQQTFTNNSPNINLSISYNKPGNAARGWTDKIELNATCAIKMVDAQLNFRKNRIDPNTTTSYTLAGATNNTKVWNVTSPTDVANVSGSLAADLFVFKSHSDSVLQEFWAFDAPTLSPIALGAVPNQNLHGSPPLDMVIVSHPSFVTQANQLAAHRQAQGLRVAVVEPQTIYNEFCSGKQDVTAIRDFLRMLYNQATNPNDIPKYLLLVGDASYDYKNRINNNTNFVPCYESEESLHHILSHTSDSYFGLLDASEGDYSFTDKMDIAVGRLPVSSPEQAQDITNKIIAYDNPSGLGDWRNTLSLVADDEDNNLHVVQCNGVGNIITSKYPNGILDKIYFDAFRQESQNGGQRYPEAKTNVINRINKGALTMSYIGHGGQSGWAQEYVFIENDLNLLNNKDRYPFMVTGTCALAPFDNPNRFSFGENLFLRPNAGSMAMFTTVRKTFPGDNYALTANLFNNYLFTKNPQTNQNIGLGEACRLAMNGSLASVNTRSFVYFGDPATQLAIPTQKAIITQINNQTVSSTSPPDTLSALEKVRFNGKITDENNNFLSSFNGTVYPTVYDKISTLSTLANDAGESAVTAFTKYERILYKGKASVVNGNFSFEFIVPKDIAYNFGFGRVNLYAENGNIDASGSFSNFYVGGTATQAKADSIGPDIKLYLNDNKFVSGSITNTNPTLFAVVTDSCGINTTGNGIGHDITAILDGNLTKTIVLNDYYQAALNSYTQGELRYPFNKLSKGNHNIVLKVWDINNNSSQASIDFTVSENDGIIINNLLNYPNPFTTKTTFHFDHNLGGQTMQAQIQVFSLEGTLVKTLTQTIANKGYHDSSFEWDGLDEYGDRIGRGVYVYKLRIKDETGATAQSIQKLVLL